MRSAFAVFLTGIVLVAGGQAVEVAYSTNVVGYARVTVPGDGGVVLLGLNFKRVGGEAALKASEVFGVGQLERGDEPLLADTVFVWDPSQGGGLGGYDAVFQRIDGVFREVETLAPLDPEIPTGGALFVSTREGSADRQIVVVGEVVYEAQRSVAFPAGLSMLASPYAAPLDLNGGAGPDWSGATAGALPTLADNVFIWNPGKGARGGFDVYYLDRATHRWHSIEAPGVVAGGAVIAVGGGAIYSARSPFVSLLARPYPP
jgi:hypothetical protein